MAGSSQQSHRRLLNKKRGTIQVGPAQILPAASVPTVNQPDPNAVTPGGGTTSGSDTTDSGAGDPNLEQGGANNGDPNAAAGAPADTITTPTVPLVATPPAATVPPVLTPTTTLPTTTSTPTPSSSVISIPSFTSVPPSLTIPPVAGPTNATNATNPSSSGNSTSSGSNSGSSNASGGGGLSAGAAACIVLAVLAIVAGIAAYFLRRYYQRRRQLRRNTWGAGLIPSLDEKREQYGTDGPMRRSGEVALVGGEDDGQMVESNGAAGGMMAAPLSAQVDISHPPNTFGNAYGYASGPGPIKPSPIAQFGAAGMVTSPTNTYAAPSSALSQSPSRSNSGSGAMMNSTSPAPISPSVEQAIVVRTFIPSLPDELQISNGERIAVISAYDDGWALCANQRGEQGVVPLECLQRGAGAMGEMQLMHGGGMGAGKRMSSLGPVPAGTY